MDYEKFYEKITRPFRRDERLHSAMIYFNMYFTYAMYALYPCLLLWEMVFRRDLALKTILVPGFGFVILTYIRKIINRKRPYETYSLDVLLEKSTKGNSMPSRHVFSAVIISMCVMKVSPLCGVFLLILSAVSCAVRVLLGVHYPSDVTAGYLCGLACGILL